MNRFWLTVVCGLLLGSGRSAVAACGLDLCPMPETSTLEVDAAGAGHLQLRTRHTGFDFGGLTGSHSDFIITGIYSGLPRIELGSSLPLVWLKLEGSTWTGLSNPVVYGQWRFIDSGVVEVDVGTQLELPLGRGSVFIADSHLLGLAYTKNQEKLKEIL